MGGFLTALLRSRIRIALVASAFCVVAAGTYVVTTGTHTERVELELDRARLAEQIEEDIAVVNETYASLEEARSEALRGFRSMNLLWSLGRSPERVAEAHDLMEGPIKDLERTRAASGRISGLIGEMEEQLVATENALTELDTVSDGKVNGDLDHLHAYLARLEEVRVAMIAFDDLVGEVLIRYDELKGLTETFFEEYRSNFFFNDRAAAEIYSERTRHLHESLSRFQEEVNAVEVQIVTALEASLTSFRSWRESKTTSA